MLLYLEDYTYLHQTVYSQYLAKLHTFFKLKLLKTQFI